MKFLLVFVCIALLLPKAGRSQEILFEDSFDSGISPAWTIPHGGWSWATGRLMNTTTCEMMVCMPDIWAGGADQADYLIKFDITLFQPSPGPSGMSLLVETMFNGMCDGDECPDGSFPAGYSFDVGYESGAGIILRNGTPYWGGVIAQIPHGDPRCLWTPGVAYHVVCGRDGTNLVFNKWPIGDPEPAYLMSAPDDTYHAGYWGITIYSGRVLIDNFVVEGTGAVPTANRSWGEVKALFR